MIRVEQVMGMPIVLEVRDEEIGEATLDEVFDWFRRVDATFSTYRAESEISRLNRRELSVEELSDDVREVLARCEELREETGGYFDARAPIPGGIDPSGLVKGWSVDRAVGILEAAGARHFSINAGGDVRVHGQPAAGHGWRVGIQHPTLKDKIAAVVVAEDLAVATSGAYERGDHVLDPHTGRPPAGVLSVTVVGRELATADAYATAAYAMGTAGAVWTARLHGYEAMTILADERVLSTAGFPAAEPVRS
jgi:thiamine biosynthesis lipoprotein